MMQQAAKKADDESIKRQIATSDRRIQGLQKKLSLAMMKIKELEREVKKQSENLQALTATQIAHAKAIDGKSQSWADIVSNEHDAAGLRNPRPRKPNRPLQDPTKELVLRGVPYSSQETQQHLQEYVQAIAEHKNIDIRNSDFRILRALARDGGRRQPIRSRHPKIIIVLSSNILKRMFKARSKNAEGPLLLKHLPAKTELWDHTSMTPIYLSENLTPEQNKLFYLVRKLKSKLNYKYAWTRDGYCYMRKTADSKAIPIHNETDLTKLQTANEYGAEPKEHKNSPPLTAGKTGESVPAEKRATLPSQSKRTHADPGLAKNDASTRPANLLPKSKKSSSSSPSSSSCSSSSRSTSSLGKVTLGKKRLRSSSLSTIPEENAQETLSVMSVDLINTTTPDSSDDESIQPATQVAAPQARVMDQSRVPDNPDSAASPPPAQRQH